jgi:hypothetical protein
MTKPPKGWKASEGEEAARAYLRELDARHQGGE